ncbi:MAG: alpha/beta fold hydrolase [Alphaproteobacteria bacterium]|nr:MAG: alpha/beta fold hydrolase [Alphaproteobacteria bacterium]
MPEVIFNGPSGRIEGRYQHGPSKTCPIAVMLHPHPLHGGTMNNKVVYALYQTFLKRGFSTLRFNYRGVGRSQGNFDRGEGELADAAAALDWLQTYNPNAESVWIAGFSFGAWIGMQLLMRRPEIAGFISVAPPAGLFDFGFLAPCPSSGLMVSGGQDEIIPEGAVQNLVKKLSAQKGITITHHEIKDANHYFTEHLDELCGTVDKYLIESMQPAKPVRVRTRRA